jgi:hypothetical protein
VVAVALDWNGPERLVLPGLHVARRPVVEQAVAEDHRLGLLDRDGLAHPRRGAHDRAQLQLEVEAAGGAEDRRVGALWPDLPPGAAHGRARHHDRRRAAVVADGQVEPVRRQRRRAAQDRARVLGVVPACIEIGVARDAKRQMERGAGEGPQMRRHRAPLARLVGQDLREPFPQAPPDLGSPRP